MINGDVIMCSSRVAILQKKKEPTNVKYNEAIHERKISLYELWEYLR